MTPAPPVAGLPEGTELVKIGVAGDDDFELVGTMIFKGKRAGAASGVIVKPAQGYSFQPLQIADVKTLSVVDGPAGSYMAVKQMETPLMITATLKLAVVNSFDQKVVDDTLEALKGLPGFLSLDR